jgi:hypothetical protein
VRGYREERHSAGGWSGARSTGRGDETRRELETHRQSRARTVSGTINGSPVWTGMTPIWSGRPDAPATTGVPGRQRPVFSSRLLGHQLPPTRPPGRPTARRVQHEDQPGWAEAVRAIMMDFDVTREGHG